MRQSEGNRRENKLAVAALTALFIASRDCVVRWGTRWARSRTLLLKTTLLWKDTQKAVLKPEYSFVAAGKQFN